MAVGSLRAVGVTAYRQAEPAEATGPSVPAKGRRNTAIDVLRGYCIVMMITSHTATSSYVNQAVHMLRFISGAEGFVFLSGLVMGLVYRRKMAAGLRKAYFAIWRRSRVIWLVHCVSVLLALSLNSLLFHYGDLPSVGQVGVPKLVWLTVTLQLQPGHMLNILPMYVFLLALAPAALELMRHGRTDVLLAASLALFIHSQYQPGALRWAHELSGGEAFPVPSWQVLFFPGMVIGYHYRYLRSVIVGPHKRALLWCFAAATAAIMVIVTVQTPHFEFYDHMRWDLFLWERHPLRFGRVLYFLVSVSAFYLMAQAWLARPRLPRAPLLLLETLGRNSLYSFLTHLAIAFAVGAIATDAGPWYVGEVLAVASVLVVFLCARYQVARRWIPN